MKRYLGILLVLAILAAFSSGCAGVSKDTQVKCPKCGAVFTIDESAGDIYTGMPRAPK